MSPLPDAALSAEQRMLRLSPAGLVLLDTDGVTDATDVCQQAFEMECLKCVLLKHRHAQIGRRSGRAGERFVSLTLAPYRSAIVEWW
jgi:hypothetical protein